MDFDVLSEFDPLVCDQRIATPQTSRPASRLGARQQHNASTSASLAAPNANHRPLPGAGTAGAEEDDDEFGSFSSAPASPEKSPVPSQPPSRQSARRAVASSSNGDNHRAASKYTPATADASRNGINTRATLQLLPDTPGSSRPNSPNPMSPPQNGSDAYQSYDQTWRRLSGSVRLPTYSELAPAADAAYSTLRDTWSSLRSNGTDIIAHGTAALLPDPDAPSMRLPPDGAPGFYSQNGYAHSHRHGFDLAKDTPPRPVRLTGIKAGTRQVLDDDTAERIRISLPPRLKLATEWSLLYSLDQHGVSLTTLYERTQRGLRGSESGCVLVVRDSEGSVFGAYVNEAFRKSDNYYGNGESFLWRRTSFDPNDFRIGSGLRTYKYTGHDDYIIQSDVNFISVGTGGGHYGLWLDAALEKGFTTTCATFNNEVLCESGVKRGPSGLPEAKFEIVSLEIWGVGINAASY
ncbi:uncharacterized protein L969DRAFT_94122 [Mixia osmundae IAM 14324]|uniref:Oxidation resistance protein 1 n=1 Tax=Mixia osmundae (strain CBS 9802 / IAM 14324 / JCM 22182 / KY 12970) TaxID=764103 RepID=G7E2S4_MIXOS|nr:uncharacterized protein L969DRAFT_94122 [Mixia osmundae IAM 14324]KEI40315.1 hypothetical protein L969DRAFT_94122 [Mixia osmundae IAM 14324]GAA97134.1 hypothetical protein E5Q_03809 [Mixia osmundae IAM 14324]